MKTDTMLTNALLGSTQNLRRANDIIFAHFKMTAAGHEILKHIDSGVLTTTELARVMDNSLSSISHKTKALEAARYIRRSFNAQDKRVWRFETTDHGRATLALLDSVYQKAITRLYCEFSEDQKQQVIEFLTLVDRHLDQLMHIHKPAFEEFLAQLAPKKNGDQ